MGNDRLILKPNNGGLRDSAKLSLSIPASPDKLSENKHITSFLIKRSSEDLKSSRCSAYLYLIP